MLTSLMIKKRAEELGADLCGIGDIKYFKDVDPQRNPLSVLPNATCIIGFGFRIPRALYKNMQRKTQYYPYTLAGVKCIDEDLSEVFLLKMASLIEDEGYDACIHRNVSNLKIKGDKSTNPEVLGVYQMKLAEPVGPGKAIPDVIFDFAQCAQTCGMGSISRMGKVLVPKFGPYVRFVFLVTDAPLELDEPFTENLCDGCGECAKACPGHAIDLEKGIDTWQCSVYYRGAHESNPFITDAFLKGNPEREAILKGKKRFNEESAKTIYPQLDFLPSRPHLYAPCLCGKACEVACYEHLKRSGKI